MFGAKYSRLKYWIWSVILLIIEIPFTVISNAPMGDIKSEDVGILLLVILLLMTPGILWINTLANRIRDYGNNPWLALWALIPIVNIFFGFYYGIINKRNTLIYTLD